MSVIILSQNRLVSNPTGSVEVGGCEVRLAPLKCIGVARRTSPYNVLGSSNSLLDLLQTYPVPHLKPASCLVLLANTSIIDLRSGRNTR